MLMLVFAHLLILYSTGLDADNDKEMLKLNNWLMFGHSNSDIMGTAWSDLYENSFFVISRDGF